MKNITQPKNNIHAQCTTYTPAKLLKKKLESCCTPSHYVKIKNKRLFLGVQIHEQNECTAERY